MASLISIHTIPFKNQRNNNRRGFFSSNLSTNRTGTGTKSQSEKKRLYKSNSFSSMSTTFRSKQVVDYLTPTKKEKQKTKVSYHLNNSNIKGSGSVQSQLTVPDMESKNIIIPPVPLIQEFNKQVEIIDNSISFCKKENEKLIELQSLLLAKMGK